MSAVSDSTPLKLCRKCGIKYPATPDNFHRDSTKSDGLRSQCKPCLCLQRQSEYQENPEPIKARVVERARRIPEVIKVAREKFRAENRQRLAERERANYRSLRLEVVREYGSACACCGEAEVMFLEIDHILSDGAQHRREIGRSTTKLYRWLKRNGFPKDTFQLLCANCNQGKQRNGGICPHKQGKA